VSSTGTTIDRVPTSPSGIPARFVRGRANYDFTAADTRNPHKSPRTRGVVGMRLQSVVLKSFVAQGGPDQGWNLGGPTAKER
jgi:hypothetical protein